MSRFELHRETVRVLLGPGRGHRFPARGLGPRAAINVVLGGYEREVARFLMSLDVGLFIDIGAATGYFSRLMARKMGPSGTVLACEPDPEMRRSLALIADDRGPLAPILVRAQAIGAEQGQATLLSRSGSCSRLQGVAMPMPEVEATAAVEVRTLDSVFAEMQPAGRVAIKIDVEGAELDVLRGGRSALTGSHPAIAVECHSMPILAEALELLHSYGYDELAVTAGGDNIGPPHLFARKRR